EGNLSGVVRDRPRKPKHGIALLALRSRVPVFPVYIAGGPRTDQLLRSWLLPSPRSVRVIVGPRVGLAADYGRPVDRRVLEEVTTLIMKRVQDLRPLRKKEAPMSTTATELTRKHCVPCEGGVPKLAADAVRQYLEALPDWKLTADGQRIRREWRVKDFVTG